MNVFEIFTPGKTPVVTLVDDHLIKKKAAFLDALAQGGILISISGPSKSGKTVFVKNIVGAENLVPISGAGVSSSDELWLRVFHMIGTPIEESEVAEQGTTVTISGAAKAAGSAIFAKAEASLGASGAMLSKQGSSKKASIDRLQLLIKELAGTDFVIFIDDFHYIPYETQIEVSRQIKEAIDKGVKIACASVPYHSEDVLRANSDLRGRIVNIDFEYWPENSLRQIPQKGFRALNGWVPDSTLDSLVAEVAGSPQLMQSLCLSASLESGVRETTSAPWTLQSDSDFYGEVCLRTAVGANYSSTLEKLEEGPKTRGTDRNQYRLTDGSVGDVYSILLKAIALDPPTLHFRYSNLTDRIKKICETVNPSGSSVTGACLQIAQLANDGQARAIIDWDAAEDVLDIRDPYLLFYIRWNKPRT